jgi:hypothetical protein
MVEFEPGDYLTRGGNGGVALLSGRCAGCTEWVHEVESPVVRYAPGQRGGIFHERCAPIGAHWYALDEGKRDASE